MKQVFDIMTKLIDTVPQLSMYRGLGHCVYGSRLLQLELEKIGIVSDILAGGLLLNTNETFDMKAETKRLILSMDDDSDVGKYKPVFSKIRSSFIRRAKTLSPKSGHAVVLIDKTIYDITSGQFDLPNTYTFDFFVSCWNELRKIDVTIGTKPDKFLVNGIKTLEVYNKASHKFVPYVSPFKKTAIAVEGFFNW